MNAVVTKFNKKQLMTVMLAATVPVNLVDECRIVFGCIRKNIGKRSRYFVVFQEGDDTEKTRFFVTREVAKHYFNYLTGQPGVPEGDPDTWGHKTFEQMKRMIEGDES